MSRQVVGVFGGSFNPPHVGHGLVSAWLLWTRRVDRVWLLPTFEHAFGKDLAPFQERLQMCSALARDIDEDRIAVCSVERDLTVPSYTVDTLDHLSAAHPHLRFCLVVGADQLPDTARWKDWARIATEWDPIVVGRQGWPPPPDAPVFPPISSTEIRNRLSAGRSVAHLLTAGVRERATRIYGETGGKPT